MKKSLPIPEIPGLRDALTSYLLAVADDELIVGHRHSEWTGFAPDIESDVALSSIAQEEMGHARLFYERVGDLTGDDPDELAFSRRPEQFRNAVLVERPNDDWGYTIVRLFLYDRADVVRLAGLAGSAVAPLAELAGALQREEKYHLLYGEQWLQHLAAATEESRARVQRALDRAWPEAMAVFEPVSGQRDLHAAGVLTTAHDAQLTRFTAETGDLLARTGLRVPALADPGGGGRAGQHTDDLRILLDEMTSVWRMERHARW